MKQEDEDVLKIAIIIIIIAVLCFTLAISGKHYTNASSSDYVMGFKIK